MSATGILTVKKLPIIQKGFTLFEIIIVVAIVGITVNIILISGSWNLQSNNLNKVGDGVQRVINLLHQEAIFDNKNYAISLHENGYNILEFNGESWEFNNQSFFRKYQIPESLVSQLIIDGLEVEKVAITEPIPHILILASGEMTTFEWVIKDIDNEKSIRLQGNLLGQVLMTGAESSG